MVKYKLFPFRRSMFLIPILFLGMIYHAAIEHILFFDPKAPDLAKLDGAAIKQQYLRTMLSIQGSLFEYNFFQSFIFPILIVFAVFIYHFVKTRHLKYVIGKQRDYDRRLFSLKCQMGGVIVGLVTILLLVIIGIALVINRREYPQLEMYFNPHSILRIFARGTWAYLLYYFLIKASALFVQTLFACYLVDYYVSFPKAALLYLFLLWGLAPILYSFLPVYLVPMSNLMITAYGGVSLWQVALTYLPFLLMYGVLKVRKSYEVD